jgi:hypothetical protein
MTTTTQTAPQPPIAPYDQRFAALTRTVMGAYLDAFEKAALGLADYQRDTAQATDLEWVAATGVAQAELSREITKAYVKAARDLVN